MALTDKYIEKVHVGSDDHVIVSKYISAATTNSPDSGYKTWKDITDLVETSFDISVVWTATQYAATTAPSAADLAKVPSGVTVHYKSGESSATGTLTASASTKNTLYLVYEKNSFYEYATTYNGSAYGWEKIGSTDIDLSNYALKGTYTSSTPSTNVTGSGGDQTASGTATVTYKKSATATGSAGGGTANSNTGNASGGTVDFTKATFTGTTATFSLSADYQPAGTISKPGVTLTSSSKTVVTGGTTTSVVTGVEASGTTDVVTGVGANGTASVVTTAIKGAALSTGTTATTGYVKYVESASHTNASLGTASTTVAVTGVSGGTASLTTKNYGFSSSTSNIMSAPTVASGVLSWTLVNASTQDVLSSTGASASSTATVITGYPNFSGGGFSTTTKYATITTTAAGSTDKTTVLTGVKATGTATVVTGVQASGTTDAYTSFTTATVNHVTGAALAATPTFTGTTATITVEGSYQPAGSISGSQTLANHSHTYTAPAAHTHSITLTDTEITGTAAVAVAAHTHSLSNHTHSVTI